MADQKQYAERDIEELDDRGGYYFRHVSAMTGEQLHSKSDIAAELGRRDMMVITARAEKTGEARIGGCPFAHEVEHFHFTHARGHIVEFTAQEVGGDLIEERVDGRHANLREHVFHVRRGVRHKRH